MSPKDLDGSLYVLGSGGSVEFWGFAVNEVRHWCFAEARPGNAEVLTRNSINPPNVYWLGHQVDDDHVVLALRGRSLPLVDGHEGRSSLELVATIYESTARGSDVTLPLKTKHGLLGRRN